MTLSEFVNIIKHLDDFETDQTTYLLDHYKKISKDEMINKLSTLDFSEATLIKENQTHIVYGNKSNVLIKLKDQWLEHLWIKDTFHKIRYRIDVSYDGSFYKGSQKQGKTSQTIQEVLERVLNHLFQERIQLHFASRTDKGVHAYQNIAHFDVSRRIDLTKYLNLANRMLPHDIFIINWQETSPFFHSRFDVSMKTYIYKITHENNLMHWHKKKYISKIDMDDIIEKSKLFIGTHDFKNYSKHGDYEDTHRTIQHIDIVETLDGFDIVITGKGFLRYMVRMIVGAIIESSPRKIKEGLTHPNISISNNLYEPNSLYLKSIEY